MTSADTPDAITGADPYALFDAWFAEARAHEPGDPEAVALATATPGGAPSARMVLMKDHGPALCGTGGFVFYTNAHSRKGAELLANPQAAMLFHWKSLRRQVRIEGRVSPVPDAMADAYFASRGRDSQIGATASRQSAPLPSRAAFLAAVARVGAATLGRKVPRPPHWTGFCLAPSAFEVWIDRPFRLHERRRFTRAETSEAETSEAETSEGGGWASALLYP